MSRVELTRRRPHPLGVVVFVTMTVLIPLMRAVPGKASPAASQPVGCQPSWPVIAHHAGGQVVALPPGTPRPVACATPTGYATSESTIAVGPDNTLVYSPAQSENSLARSTAGSATWSLTRPSTEQPTAFWNTVDPDLISDRRTGWIFWSHATGPVRNEGGLPDNAGFYLAAASGFQVYSSSDGARTFRTADYSSAPTGDWEKIFVGPPPPASSGAPQPKGYPDVVYLCANSPLEVTGPGRLCYKSLDGGLTFTMAGYVSPSVGEPPDICPPLNFNTGVVDASGNTYQPATCQDHAYVVVSHDEGTSYQWHMVPGVPTGVSPGDNYLQLALDDAGNLYAMWPAGGQLFLAISRDHGLSWQPPLMVSAPGIRNATLPSLSAGATGRVAIAYYANPDAAASMLDGYITETTDALASRPLFYSGMLNDPAHPIFHDYGLSSTPRADFIGGAYDQKGLQFWAGMVKQLGPLQPNGEIETTGYVGRLNWMK
ncbi:MAG: sialidase family protein [Acidimicrobiales bacterium]